MGKDFMTDSYLIFNRSMYQKLFFFQERSVAPLFFYIGFVFVVLANLVKIPKNYKLLINTIFITAVVYVVLISKVSYFHIYYHNIPVISLIIISSMIFLLFELYRYQII
ncbi:TPA: hypothetical protein DEP21_04360 [Patescibacteria group bacterium]|nr:hypothetical protein [Candidatus Gracilibacteria bacterium]